MAEDNFRLVARTLDALLTEQHHLSSVTKRQAEFAAHQAELLREQAAASERQASRIEELIGLMGSFAEGSTDVRQRLGRCEERLDNLEDAG